MALRDHKLRYSKKQIDDAGKALAGLPVNMNYLDALDVLNNFRACHGYPINTFQSTLRHKIKTLDVEALVSQRLKRTPSIVHKIERFTSMRLSQMQDIGGLRAVLATAQDVYKLVDEYKKTTFAHTVKNEKDYINAPKDSGYRCYHIVYEYKNYITPDYDGLMIELQIRTRLQHAWATAVETVGTFLDHSLKSSQGPEEWLEFFALVSHAFTFVEGTSPIPQYSAINQQKAFSLVKKDASKLRVIEQLTAFSQVVERVQTDKRQGSLHLVVLDIAAKEVNIKSYSKQSIEEASVEYLKEEALITEQNKKQVVLVSSDSIDSLKKAYPSYFLDTQEFLRQLTNIISEAK